MWFVSSAGYPAPNVCDLNLRTYLISACSNHWAIALSSEGVNSVSVYSSEGGGSVDLLFLHCTGTPDFWGWNCESQSGPWADESAWSFLTKKHLMTRSLFTMATACGYGGVYSVYCVLVSLNESMCVGQVASVCFFCLVCVCDYFLHSFHPFSRNPQLSLSWMIMKFLSRNLSCLLLGIS